MNPLEEERQLLLQKLLASVSGGFMGMGGKMGRRSGFSPSARPFHTFNPYMAQLRRGIPGLRPPTGEPDWVDPGSPAGGVGGGGSENPSQQPPNTFPGLEQAENYPDYSEEEMLNAARRSNTIQRRLLGGGPTY